MNSLGREVQEHIFVLRSSPYYLHLTILAMAAWSLFVPMYIPSGIIPSRGDWSL
jgi:hypothetical protein